MRIEVVEQYGPHLSTWVVLYEKYVSYQKLGSIERLRARVREPSLRRGFDARHLQRPLASII
jgi:hypothetical protein